MFQPLKLLFARKYPAVVQLSNDAARDRIVRLMKSEEGQVLLRMVAEEIDQLSAYATDPSMQSKPHEAAHANGGIYSMRRFMQKLESFATAQPPKNKRLTQTQQ